MALTLAFGESEAFTEQAGGRGLGGGHNRPFSGYGQAGDHRRMRGCR
jgi:hypothetical protein